MTLGAAHRCTEGVLYIKYSISWYCWCHPSSPTVMLRPPMTLHNSFLPKETNCCGTCVMINYRCCLICQRQKHFSVYLETIWARVGDRWKMALCSVQTMNKLLALWKGASCTTLPALYSLMRLPNTAWENTSTLPTCRAQKKHLAYLNDPFHFWFTFQV